MADFVARVIIALAIGALQSGIQSRLADKKALEKPQEQGFRVNDKIKGLGASNEPKLGDPVPLIYGRMNVVPSHVARRFALLRSKSSFSFLTREDKYTASYAYKDLQYNSTINPTYKPLQVVSYPKITAYMSMQPNSLLGLVNSTDFSKDRTWIVPRPRDSFASDSERFSANVFSSSLLGSDFVDRIGTDTLTANHGMVWNEGMDRKLNSGLHIVSHETTVLANSFNSFLKEEPLSRGRLQMWINNIYQGVSTETDALGSSIGIFDIPKPRTSSNANTNSIYRKFDDAYTIRSFGEVESDSNINWSSIRTGHFGNNTVTGNSNVKYPLNQFFVNDSDLFPVRSAPNSTVTSTRSQEHLRDHNRVRFNLAPANYPNIVSQGNVVLRYNSRPVVSHLEENLLTSGEHSLLAENYSGVASIIGHGDYETDFSAGNSTAPIIYNGDKRNTNPSKIKFTKQVGEVFALPNFAIDGVSTSPFTTSFLEGDETSYIKSFPFFREVGRRETVDKRGNVRTDAEGNPITEPIVEYDTSLKFRDGTRGLGRFCDFKDSQVLRDHTLLRNYSSKITISPDSVINYGFSIDLSILQPIVYYERNGDDWKDISGQEYTREQAHTFGGSSFAVTMGSTLFCRFCILFRAATVDNSEEDQNTTTWYKRYFKHQGTTHGNSLWPIRIIFTTAERNAMANKSVEIRIVRTPTYIQDFHADGYTHSLEGMNPQTGVHNDNSIRNDGYIRGLAPREETFTYRIAAVTAFLSEPVSGVDGAYDDNITYLYYEVSALNALPSKLGKLSITLSRRLPVFDRAKGRWTDDAPVVTRNPIWAIADMLRNPQYGAGKVESRYINGEMWADLAEQLDNEGRYYDDVISNSLSLEEAISRALLSARGSRYYKDTQHLIYLDRRKQDSDIVRMFTDKNVIEGSFSASIRGKDRGIAEVILGVFNNEQSDYRETSTYIDKDGRKLSLDHLDGSSVSRFKFNGITERSRVISEGRHSIRTNKYNNLNITFSVGREGESLNIGDFIILALNAWKPCFSGYIQETQLIDVPATNTDPNPPRTLRIKLSEPAQRDQTKEYIFYYQRDDGRPVGPFDVIGSWVTPSLVEMVGTDCYKSLPADYFNVIDIEIPPADSNATETALSVAMMQSEMLPQLNQEPVLFLYVEKGSATEENEILQNNFLKLNVVSTNERMDNAIEVSAVNYTDKVYD